jgi:hypothetical protein
MTVKMLMDQIRDMGAAQRHEREEACVAQGKHRVQVLSVDVPNQHTITYCGDCLLIFIDDVAVNSTLIA